MMIDDRNSTMKELMSEIFIIVSGVILAETIVNQVISLTITVIPKWVLILWSILLLTTAIDFKKQYTLFRTNIVPLIYTGIPIGLIVLLKKEIINSVLFLWIILPFYLLVFIFYLIFLIKRKE